ncbi:MAG: hypothetical protein P8012_11935 [Desulfobacterales bacterium]
MPQNPKQKTLADPGRFKTIQDLTRLRPDCGASIDDILVIDNGFMLIIDLSHIGNMLNPYNSPSAAYVRTHGVIVRSHVHTEYRPVFWSEPFLLLPMSCHLNENLTGYDDIGKVVEKISCPSGAFLLLPAREDIPMPLGSMMGEALASEGGVKIKLPNGTYRVFYEQFEVPEGSKQEFYRNVVVQKQ